MIMGIGQHALAHMLRRLRSCGAETALDEFDHVSHILRHCCILPQQQDVISRPGHGITKLRRVEDEIQNCIPSQLLKISQHPVQDNA